MGLEASVWSETNTYDVIIVGGGIAAMTAAIYLKRANLKVAFIESNMPGGKIVNISSIENIPSFLSINGADYAYKIFEQTNNLKVEYIYGEVVDIRPSKSDKYIVATNDNILRLAKTVLICTGSKENKLNVKGEEEYLNKGVSYCAICDGTLTKEKEVVVVGGGNSAITGALYLSKIAKKVSLVHRRDEFRADAILVKEIKKTRNISLVLNQNVSSIEGDGKKIEKIILDDGKSIPANFIFIYVGSSAATNFLNKEIALDNHNYIKVDDRMETNWKGIYAAGDCISKANRQITTAMGDATNAALSIIDYINKNQNL